MDNLNFFYPSIPQRIKPAERDHSQIPEAKTCRGNFITSFKIQVITPLKYTNQVLLSTIFSNSCEFFSPLKKLGEKKKSLKPSGGLVHQLTNSTHVLDQTPGLNHMISEANRKEKALKEAGRFLADGMGMVWGMKYYPLYGGFQK